MYHADLLGGWAAHFRGGPPVVWAVHSTVLAAWRATWKTRVVRQLCAWLSTRIPVDVLTDSHATAQVHAALGYPPLTVIQNGVDADQFKPDSAGKCTARRAWGVGADEKVIGLVARWDPLKDHDNLLQAVAILARRGTAFRCLLAGGGMTRENADLMRLVERHGVTDRVILAGPQTDVPAVMNGLDVHVLSSYSESQPIAVIEAMACGTPCVVTNVGDAAKAVGSTGWVVPPKAPAALAEAIDEALAASAGPDWTARREASRTRAVENFSVVRMADEYAAVWVRAAASRAGTA
jgi:glycosyltransferase involved in cell wall biosynthesis